MTHTPQCSVSEPETISVETKINLQKYPFILTILQGDDFQWLNRSSALTAPITSKTLIAELHVLAS